MTEKMEFTEQDSRRAQLFAAFRTSEYAQGIDDAVLSQACDLLVSEDLFGKLAVEMNKRVSGEHWARMALFLGMCGCWVKNPLQMTHVMVNSSSSAGKDYVTKAVFDLFPDNIKDYQSKITPETFTYWRTDKLSQERGFTWDGRIFYLEDCSQALLDSPTFRVMLSGGSKSVVVRDQRAVELAIVGRPLVIVTTATTKPSNELMNRFIPVSLDESKAQTINVFLKTSEVLEGHKEPYGANWRLALALLRRVNVVVPYASKINGCFPATPVSMRREMARFCTLIQNSAALFQYQRLRDESGNVVAAPRDFVNALYAYIGTNPGEKVKLTRSQQVVFDGLKALEGRFLQQKKTLDEKSRGQLEFVPDYRDNWWYDKEIAVEIGLGDRWVRELLSQLLEKGLVERQLDKTESITKARYMYRSVSGNGIVLNPGILEIFGDKYYEDAEVVRRIFGGKI